MSHTTAPIVPANITWQTDELGNCVPYSTIFGDVYYSLVDGLAESRYVFIERNCLAQRFKQCFEQDFKRGFNASLEHRSKQFSQSPLSNTPFDNKSIFTIAELGFGTGLNFLLTWMLWDQTKQQSLSEHHANSNSKIDSILSPFSPRLHFISTEKHPLLLDDLKRSLASWQKLDSKLKPYIETLVANYPTLIAGCHRIQLANDVTLDIWLGDALSSLRGLNTTYGAHVDAWYLDGFAPSANESLWTQDIFAQMRRLSEVNTSVATYSCAGIVKRGLQDAGFEIEKVAGFGRKRHMLTAKLIESSKNIEDINKQESAIELVNKQKYKISEKRHLSTSEQTIAIIGSGVCGLTTAWTLAQRGFTILLIDKISVLAGASGNPRALLAPKMTPLLHVAEHLHSMSYLYSQRFYQSLDTKCAISSGYIASNTIDNLNESKHYNSKIFEQTGTLDLLTKANVKTAQIAEYPDDMAITLPASEAEKLAQIHKQSLTDNLYLPQAGLINPRALADTILAHPLIHFARHNVVNIAVDSDSDSDSDSADVIDTNSATQNDQVKLTCEDGQILNVSTVIIAAGYESYSLDTRIFDFRKIRGQLSWFIPSAQQRDQLPVIPLKYGGYCAPFIPQTGDDTLNTVVPNQPTFLLGASFERNDVDSSVKTREHLINRDKLVASVDEFDAVLTQQVDDWQARVGIRAQTPDYHPCIGQIDQQGLIWTISGMGSKGYAFAPLCAQILADMLTAQFMPVSNTMLARLSPQRPRLQTPLST